MAFHVEPAWRPGVLVAMLYWLFSNPVPATIALTAPVVGSIATSDAVKPGFSPIDSSTAFSAFACAFGSMVV